MLPATLEHFRWKIKGTDNPLERALFGVWGLVQTRLVSLTKPSKRRSSSPLPFCFCSFQKRDTACSTVESWLCIAPTWRIPRERTDAASVTPCRVTPFSAATRGGPSSSVSVHRFLLLQHISSSQMRLGIIPLSLPVSGLINYGTGDAYIWRQLILCSRSVCLANATSWTKRIRLSYFGCRRRSMFAYIARSTYASPSPGTYPSLALPAMSPFLFFSYVSLWAFSTIIHPVLSFLLFFRYLSQESFAGRRIYPSTTPYNYYMHSAAPSNPLLISAPFWCTK